jgi:hypothetical protein
VTKLVTIVLDLIKLCFEEFHLHFKRVRIEVIYDKLKKKLAEIFKNNNGPVFPTEVLYFLRRTTATCFHNLGKLI